MLLFCQSLSVLLNKNTFFKSSDLQMLCESLQLDTVAVSKEGFAFIFYELVNIWDFY